MKDYSKFKTFDELIELERGKTGSESRNKYGENAKMFILSEIMKSREKRNKPHTEAIGAKGRDKKSYFSKLDNRKGNIMDQQ